MLSVGGLVGTPMLSSNSATRGAVRLLAKSSAANGIRVNSVHPGITATGLWNKIGPLDANGRNTPTEPHELARTVALDVPAKPREIAAALLFLASDASSYVTGSEVVVDGSMTAGMAGCRARPDRG
jgi:NAD(P)-dependent dehydrogenase (short-subunit alcohol dehydrogenase family)